MFSDIPTIPYARAKHSAPSTDFSLIFTVWISRSRTSKSGSSRTLRAATSRQASTQSGQQLATEETTSHAESRSTTCTRTPCVTKTVPTHQAGSPWTKRELDDVVDRTGRAGQPAPLTTVQSLTHGCNPCNEVSKYSP